MAENEKYGLREVKLQHDYGFVAHRAQGEGLIIQDFGQIFLIKHNEDQAIFAIQSPTDFNYIEFQTIKPARRYRFIDQDGFIGFEPKKDGSGVVLTVDFPINLRILKQEHTSITQNLQRPIK